MSFDNLPRSKPAPRRSKKLPVFCVGWRAFVHWPPRPGKPVIPVPLVDATGRQLANDLLDGDEIEVLSWKPRSREGVVYQVVRISDRTEWWISANYMRRERQAVAPALDLDEQGRQ